MNGLAIRGASAAPVAFVHWDNAAPKLAIFDEEHRSAVEALVLAELKASSFRIVRQKDPETGNILLREKQLRPGTLGFLGRAATRLTFSPLNGHNFVTTVERNLESAVSGEGSQEPIVADLLLEGDTSEPTIVCLACGFKYPIQSPRCGSCKTPDPLGSYLARNESTLRADCTKRAAARIRAVGALMSIREMKRGFDRSIKSYDNRTLLPTDDDSREISLKKMLEYHKEIFQLDYLSAENFSTIRTEIAACTDEILAMLTQMAEETRTSWLGSPRFGWKASAEFAQSLATRLQDTWTRPLQSVKTSALELVQCAAGFNRFATKWEEELAHETDFWDVIKVGWRAFRACATWGVSELIKLGVGLLKEAKDQKAWEQFANKLLSSVENARSTSNVIQAAFRAQHELAQNLASGLHAHLIRILSADYATLSDSERTAVVVRLGVMFGDVNQMDNLSPGGHKRPWRHIMVIGLVAIAVLVVWLLIR